MPTSPKGRFVPMPPDHPLIGAECDICEQPVLARQVPSVIAADSLPPEYFTVGPGVRGVRMDAPPTTILTHEACSYPD